MKFKPFSKILTNLKLHRDQRYLKKVEFLKEFQRWIEQGIDQGEIGMRPEISKAMLNGAKITKQNMRPSEVDKVRSSIWRYVYRSLKKWYEYRTKEIQIQCTS